MQIDVQVKFPKIAFDYRAINEEMLVLASKTTASLVNYVKLALVAHAKVVTGDTIRSIRSIEVSNHSILPIKNSAGLWHRQVIGDYGLKFIMSGRRPGAKMPVRLVSGTFDFSGRGSKVRGTNGRFIKVVGKRGGRQFEPVPAMLRWFLALNIPKNLWFPIMRSIAKRGIKPVNIGAHAINEARPIMQTYANQAAVNIASRMIKVENAR